MLILDTTLLLLLSVPHAQSLHRSLPQNTCNSNLYQAFTRLSVMVLHQVIYF